MGITTAAAMTPVGGPLEEGLVAFSNIGLTELLAVGTMLALDAAESTEVDIVVEDVCDTLVVWKSAADEDVDVVTDAV